VYVLGAGCSYDTTHGYPLAKDFVPALNAYATKLSGAAECQRIRQAVEDTAALLTACQTGACHALTIDQLINLILNGRCDDQLKALSKQPGAERGGLRHAAVRKAKVATAACFLDREGAALRQQVGKYREFIQRKVLNETGLSARCQAKLANSSARILTFNYDRLFELAFYAAFADESFGLFSPYQAEALNSGLTAFGGIGDFAKDRFCFVKLHGSTGMLCTESPFGQETVHLRAVGNWKEEEIRDALFFPTKPNPHFVAEPMIIFPYEKDFVVSGKESKLPFRDYIKRVWDHASYVLRQASEVWIIGYSFDATDCMYLVDRLRQAEKCERIIIQNIPAECDRIEALLKVDYRLPIPVEKYPVSF